MLCTTFVTNVVFLDCLSRHEIRTHKKSSWENMRKQYGENERVGRECKRWSHGLSLDMEAFPPLEHPSVMRNLTPTIAVRVIKYQHLPTYLHINPLVPFDKAQYPLRIYKHVLFQVTACVSHIQWGRKQHTFTLLWNSNKKEGEWRLAHRKEL
jgi:hypothetical protein